jgi:2-methylisocitrate lyase-like PEP mutase family enzyme
MTAPLTVELAARAVRLRELHESGLLVIPNVWDAATAKLFEELGFPAVATASAAVCASLGYPDGGEIPPGEMFAAVGRIAASTEVPVSADLEDGYGIEPAELIGSLLATRAVGLNIEDTDHAKGRLTDAEEQAARLAAIKSAGSRAGVEVVLNARIDEEPVRTGPEPLRGLLHRAKLYSQAGADCLYPIRLQEEEHIRAFTHSAGAPVNVLIRPGSPSLRRLRDLGVRRATFGPALHRVTLTALAEFASGLDIDSEHPVFR